MRVLFTASGSHLGGSTMAMMNLMIGLRKLGAEPLLLGTEPTQIYRPYFERLEEVGIKIVYWGRGAVGASYWAGLLAAATKIVLKGSVDVLHAHTPKEGMVLSLVSRLTGRPLVYTFEGDPLLELRFQKRRLYDEALHRQFLREIVRNSAALAACSRWLASHLRENYGIDAEPIPNPVDVERFSRSGAPMGRTIVTLARLVEVKGLRTLLRAAEKVIRVDGEATFLVAGDGPMRETLERESARLEGRFRLLGFHQRPQELLKTCYMLVMPSLYEPFGMPAAEAGAASKPVVASRTGGLQEIVEDGSTGLLHRPGDHEDLAEKVLRLLKDPKLAAEMGRRGRERVMKLFSPEVVAAQYLKLYEEVL